MFQWFAAASAHAASVARATVSVVIRDPAHVREHWPTTCIESVEKEPAMPTYEYVCNKCGSAFTQFMHIEEQDRAKVQCPKCKDQDVSQRIAPVFVRASHKS